MGDSGAIFKTTNGGGSSSGIHDQPAISSSLKIYPNPFSNEISIETSANSSDSELTILNLNGQELIKRKITGSPTQINLSTLPGGVYFVKIVGELGLQVRKIIKQ